MIQHKEVRTALPLFTDDKAMKVTQKNATIPSQASHKPLARVDEFEAIVPSSYSAATSRVVIDGARRLENSGTATPNNDESSASRIAGGPSR